MSTLPELAARLAQWADQNGYSEKSEVLAIAAELRQQPQPVNAEMLAAKDVEIDTLKEMARQSWNGTEQDIDALLIDRDNWKARAESVEKAPAHMETQTMNGNLGCMNCAASPVRGWMQMPGHDGEACEVCNAARPEESTALAQPDVVSGLANSLREAIKIAASQIGEHYSAGIIYECGTGSLPIVKHVIANIILAQISVALAAYEAQSKAEPKA